ncbi:RIN4, pathogenic type III effector avirulence factor Avr cleavage site [Senna tora]|uniref:RIN4, pathogenic type III effector avirulence factor Avr cleavage site n=1 Tax=Senna tora TaxID=362788 RepID=A0A834T5W0_9FABA|nr:RIN4, pathogenic type III effector avirulence factor Avr cleavage site [Senna tora]
MEPNERKGGRMSVPQFGGWDQHEAGIESGYTVVFTKARADRLNQKTDLTEVKRQSLDHKSQSTTPTNKKDHNGGGARNNNDKKKKHGGYPPAPHQYYHDDDDQPPPASAGYSSRRKPLRKMNGTMLLVAIYVRSMRKMKTGEERSSDRRRNPIGPFKLPVALTNYWRRNVVAVTEEQKAASLLMELLRVE